MKFAVNMNNKNHECYFPHILEEEEEEQEIWFADLKQDGDS